MSAADTVTKRIDEILDLYERALRDADSPLVAAPDRWRQARGQAEAILYESMQVLGGAFEGQPDPYALTRALGFERARQQVLIADSIRAGMLLWRSAVPVLGEILRTDDIASLRRLLEVLEALHEAINVRLYIGSIAYEHARLAEHAPTPRGEPRGMPEHNGTKTVSRPENITVREWQILECTSRALSNREIAKELSLSEATVKTHLRKAFVKLGAISRVDAINKVGLAGATSGDECITGSHKK